MSQKYNQFNDRCPVCNKQELVARVVETYCNVTLGRNGYDTTGGNQVESEITEIFCNACHKNVSVNHYFS